MSFIELKRKVTIWSTMPGFIFVILFVMNILAYGLLIPWLHLYADDWLWAWTWDNYGPAGLIRYFATNRPIWGMLFQVTLPFLGSNALAYHIFALIVRWLSAIACWWLLILVLPKRRDIAFWGAAIFLVYPGFVLQSVALTYSHIFIVYIFFLLSLCFNLVAVRGTKRAWLLHLVALALSLINLLSMEYFFMLELARPVLLWIVAGEKLTGFWQRVKTAVRQWIPYLVVWIGAVLWRVFFFKVQTFNYKINLLSNLQTDPLNTLVQMIRTILIDLYQTSIGAWAQTVDRFLHMTWSRPTSIITMGLCVVIFFLVMVVGNGLKQPEINHAKRDTLQFIVIGIVLMLISGIPFWAIQLDVKPDLLDSRLTLPFMLGAIFLLIGILEPIIKPNWRGVILAFAIAIAAGGQFQNSNDFRLDTIYTRKMMWEIAWRIPDLTPGTLLLTSDIPQNFYKSQDLANIAALSTQLNILYPSKVEPYKLAYFLNFAREVDGGLPNGLEKHIAIKAHNVTAEFFGTTDQLIAATVSPKNCFRLLEPDLDTFDVTQSEGIRKAASLSNLNLISTDVPRQNLPTNLFGTEPEHSWCYYFEKADLARQMGNWQLAADIGDQAFKQGFEPHDRMEYFVFIEAFAHIGQWDRAVKLSEGFAGDKNPILCKMWQRIAADTPESGLKNQSITTVNQAYSCQ